MRTFALNFKKLFSAFMSIVIVCICTCDFSVNTKATNTGRTYYVYSPSTGNYTRNYTLPALTSSVNTRSLIGTDNRTIDWSKSGTVKILDSDSTKPYRGTGFVVNAHTIATAAHCVFKDGSAVKINEILLFDSLGNNILTATPIELHIPELFINPVDYYSNYDYALITVQEDLSNFCHYNLGVATDSFLSSSSEISLTGFPGELNNNNTGDNTMYTGTGNVSGGTNMRLYYTADSTGGNSGGPVYITESRNEKTFFTVVAIHTAGFGEDWDAEQQLNSGVRLTTDHLQFYLNNDYTLL